MRCVCGEELKGHECKLTHKERMIKFANYCLKNNTECISYMHKNITPFRCADGCVHCGTVLQYPEDYHDDIHSNLKLYNNIFALACNACRVKIDRLYTIYSYCFVNMEIPSICRDTKLLRQLLVREVYKRHKVPHDIRNLINSLLSCGC